MMRTHHELCTSCYIECGGELQEDLDVTLFSSEELTRLPYISDSTVFDIFNNYSKHEIEDGLIDRIKKLNLIPISLRDYCNRRKYPHIPQLTDDELIQKIIMLESIYSFLVIERDYDFNLKLIKLDCNFIKCLKENEITDEIKNLKDLIEI